MAKALNFLSEKLRQLRRKVIFPSRANDPTEDMQKRLDELSILNKMSIALSSGQDLYHLLRLLLEELRMLFVIDSFYIGIYDPETSIVNFPVFYEKGEYLNVEDRNLREKPGFTGAVIFNEKTLYISDLDDPAVDRQYSGQPIGKIETRSYVGVPLMLNNKVIGILSVQSEQPNAYTEPQIQLLETIAAQSAIAIERARLFSELEDDLEKRKKLIAELELKNLEAETLRESVSIVNTTLERSDAIDLILDQLERVVPYDSASVQLMQNNRLEIVKGKGLNNENRQDPWQFDIDENEPAYPILHENAPYVLYEDVQLSFAAFKESPHNHIHAWLAVPLKIEDRMLGIITLDGHEIGQFTERHARLAVTYANQVAIALENAKLYSKLQTELAERMRAEQAVRESESKLRAVIENVPFDMWVSDKDNRYIMQSGESYRLAGDIIGKVPDEIGIAPDVVAVWKMDYERAMKGETVYKEDTWEVEGEVRDFITTLAPVKDKELIIGYIGINVDITERKRAEENLRQAEFKYRTLVEQIPPIVFIAARDQHIGVTYISPRIASLGFTQEEWVADPELWLRQIHPDDRVKVLEAIEEIKRSGKPFKFEYRLRTRDGVDRWFLDESRDVTDADGNFLFRQGFMLDISERKRAEEKIQQLNAELEQRVVERTAQLQEANLNLNQEKARLERYTRQRELMAAMTDLLQASLTMREASNVIVTHLNLLFPKRNGGLYLTSSSSNTLEPVAIWGEKKSLDVIYTTNECWALRRGKPYCFGAATPNPACDHVGKDIPRYAVCTPLSAQGESLGNLHISTRNENSVETIDDEEQRFIETIADSIALAIANLRLRERLHFESIRDGLTGLFNRRYLDETLPREIHRADRSQYPISVLMFDIDHFKKFNDTFGHDAGDGVLKSVAGLMLSGIREGDIACRYGGEEFTVILPNTPLEVAARRAENLRYEVSLMELFHNGRDLGKVTISIGVATYPQHGTTRDTLIKSADEASYQAKETGRNRVVVRK